MYVNKVLTFDGMMAALDKAKINYQKSNRQINFTDKSGKKIFLSFEMKDNVAGLNYSFIQNPNGTKLMKEYYNWPYTRDLRIESLNFPDIDKYDKVATITHDKAGKSVHVLMKDFVTGKQTDYFFI